MEDAFNPKKVETTLIEVFSKHKQGNIEVCPDSAITADLGIDSLSVMEIIAELEDTYDLTFADEDLPMVKTVEDVKDLILRGLEQSGRLSV